jgi:hypothetical protein
MAGPVEARDEAASSDAATTGNQARDTRIFFFLLACVVAGVFAYFYGDASRAGVIGSPQYALRDFTQVWRGANALERGEDPWAPLATRGLQYPYGDRNAYPLPALLVARLFNHLPLPDIAFWVSALGIFLGGLALTRRNLWHIWVYLSWQMIGLARLLQWAGFMTAAARWDWAVPLVLCKPNLGLAVLAYRPTPRRLAIVAVLGVATLAFDPTWISRWREATAGMSYYVPPVSIWKAGGPLLLLAALRWRLPEGRFLLTMSLVPHNLLFYDQFLLFLVCKKGRETLALVALGWIASKLAAFLWPSPGDHETPEIQALYRIPVVALVYLPALLMVLLRKNPDRFEMEPQDKPGLLF